MEVKAMKDKDFTLAIHGSISLLMPISKLAQQWVTDNLPDESELTFYGGSIVIEHRYVRDIVDGIRADGLSV
jgi:hypothetical protein